jgi:hypothetical protein
MQNQGHGDVGDETQSPRLFNVTAEVPQIQVEGRTDGQGQLHKNQGHGDVGDETQPRLLLSKIMIL